MFDENTIDRPRCTIDQVIVFVSGNEEAFRCRHLSFPTSAHISFVLQTCPVVSKIDLLSIARQFVFLQRSYMAAALLIYCNDEQKSVIKKVRFVFLCACGF